MCKKDDRLYKNRYFFVFYEKDDETLYDMFDNVRQIVIACGREPTRDNVIKMSIKLARAVNKKTHYTNVFGRLMRVYLIDDVDDCSSLS